MKKADLVEKVADMTGGTKVQAEQIVSMIFDSMADAMSSGDGCDIAGFGKFLGKMRAARTARNPRTGDIVQVPEKRVPAFKAGKALKNKVAG